MKIFKEIRVFDDLDVEILSHSLCHRSPPFCQCVKRTSECGRIPGPYFHTKYLNTGMQHRNILPILYKYFLLTSFRCLQRTKKLPSRPVTNRIKSYHLKTIFSKRCQFYFDFVGFCRAVLFTLWMTW